MDFDLTGLFSAAGAIAGGAAVAGIVAVLKQLVLPATWHNGRAPMVLAALLAAGLTIAAEQLLDRPVDASVMVTDVLTWAAVYAAAVGTHQTVTKAGRVVAGTTDPSGPDDAARHP